MKINPNALPASTENARGKDTLKKACIDFEAIFLAQMWKEMASQAREMGGKKKDDRAFGPMEDLAIEMSSEVLAGQDGNGLWKVLYDSLSSSLPKDDNGGE